MMLKQLSFSFRRSQRRWLYGSLSMVTALSITLGTPQPSYAISWLELLFRGAQIVQLSNMSDKKEVELGKQINQQLIESNKIRLNRNEQINNYINAVGQRLAKASDRPSIPYHFQVVDDESINAFATMGGYIYLNTGLIEAADNEAELASVIAHEIGHVSSRHAVEQMRQRAISQGLLSAAGLDQSTAVQIGVDLALTKPNSREDELESDRRGLETLRRAGYAPSGMVSFMKKLQKQGGSLPAFLSTHPATSARIEALQKQIDPATANQGDGLNSAAYRSKIRAIR